MNNKDILANAPEGATHYYRTPEGETRSLADIRRIVELEKEKAEYVPVLAWIARECSQVDGSMLHRLKSYLAIRDLEQQAKALKEPKS